jgi:4a-hydroxytetrahydrobiopterin dehydratase
MTPASDRLSADQIASELTALPGWTGDPSGLTRDVKAPDFPTAIRIVDAVAEIAEGMDHHPDIDIRWRTLTFALSTHSAGGVTSKDVELARKIDSVAGEHGAE